MTDPQQQAVMNFWYELDNTYRYCDTPLMEIMLQIFNGAGGELGPYCEGRKAMDNGHFPAAYAEFMAPWRNNLAQIFDNQCQLLNENLGPSPEAHQLAFEEFGQGILWDARRAQYPSNCPRGDKGSPYDYIAVHSMDAKYPESPPVGYYSWYSYVRAQDLVNGDDGSCSLLAFARNIALAAAIQNYMKPSHIMTAKTNPNNPPIDPAQLQTFRDKYLNMSWEDLDQAFFVSDPELGPPPSCS